MLTAESPKDWCSSRTSSHAYAWSGKNAKNQCAKVFQKIKIVNELLLMKYTL